MTQLDNNYTETANRLAEWIDKSTLPPSALHAVYGAHVLLCELLRQRMARPQIDWDVVRKFLDVATLSSWMLREIRCGGENDAGLITTRVRQAARFAITLSDYIERNT